MKLAVFAFSRRGRGHRPPVVWPPWPGQGTSIGPMPRRAGRERASPPSVRPWRTSPPRCSPGRTPWCSWEPAALPSGPSPPTSGTRGTDPAVLAVDELGQFVIPLLSGHIGGANRLAARLAEAVGATAVVTTATDVNRRFSVDEWSTRQGLYIDDMAAAKAVSAAILEGPVPVWSDFPHRRGPARRSGARGERSPGDLYLLATEVPL